MIVPDSILPVALYTGMLFLGVLPSTVQSSIAFTSIAGGNVAGRDLRRVGLNIFGMFLTPLLVGVLFSVGGHGGFSWDVLASRSMLQLLAPFIAGQLLQPWIGNWIRSKKKILMPVDRDSILMVVYSAFSEAVVEAFGTPSRWSISPRVIVANMVLLALVLCITMFGGRAARLRPRRRDHHHLLRLEEVARERRADGQRHLRRPGYRRRSSCR